MFWLIYFYFAFNVIVKYNVQNYPEMTNYGTFSKDFLNIIYLNTVSILLVCVSFGYFVKESRNNILY